MSVIVCLLIEWTAGEEEEEEVINCICGIYKDEGLMIQCEKCYVSRIHVYVVG
jgi:hypothetical protein